MSYRLLSREGTAFPVTAKMANQSNLIKEMMEEDEEEEEFILPQIHARELQRVVAFMQYHENDPMAQIARPVYADMSKNGMCKWDAGLVDLPKPELVELWKAVNYLHINDLMVLTEAKLASSMLQSESLEQIAQGFGVLSTLDTSDPDVMERYNADRRKFMQVMEAQAKVEGK